MIRVYWVKGFFLKDYFPFKGFTGFTVRGALGKALRDLVCLTDNSVNCLTCPYYSECFYARLFEATPLLKPSASIGVRGCKAGIPKPYTVTPARVRENSLEFRVTLLSKEFIEKEALIIMAILKMGDLGLGFDLLKKERRKFKVARITASNPLGDTWEVFGVRGYVSSPKCRVKRLYDFFEKRILALIDLKPLTITLDFRTPFRLEVNGKVSEKPSLEEIIAHLARKYSLLAEYYDMGQPLTPQQVKKLKKIIVKYTDLINFNYRKTRLYKISIETESKKIFGTYVIGKYTYRFSREIWRLEEVKTILFLLMLGEYVNIGKGATAGCGHYNLYVKTLTL